MNTLTGKGIRDKGNRVERKQVNHCKDLGVIARRQPLSGILPDKEFKNDVIIGDLLSVEVKARKTFSDYSILELADRNTDRTRLFPAIVKKGDRKPFLVGLYLSDFISILNRR